MKWVLWLALVGLVSKGECRSINYEYENEQGLDSEQKGTAGQKVTGKYETLDHNGEIVKVKYVADHMGFRLIDGMDITDKDINSPNAEPEMEPTEAMTQTAEQTTNEPVESSVKFTEENIEPTTHTTLEAEENEGEEEEEENTGIEEEQSEEESDEEETEDKETEAKETEAEETEAEETEAEVEARNEEEITEASINEEEIESETMITEEETNPTESEKDSEAEVSPTEEENEPTVEGESMNVETEFENNNIAISERKGEDSETIEVPSEPKSLNQEQPVIKAEIQDSTVESVIPVAMKLEVISEKDNKQEELVSKKSGEVSNSKRMTIEMTADPIENYIEPSTMTSSLSTSMINKQEVIAIRIEPPAQINSEISNINIIEIEQETLQHSPKAKSILSVQNIDNAPITEMLLQNIDNAPITEILQVPTSAFSLEPLPSLPQPLQLVDVINSNSNELESEQNVLAKSLNTNPGLSIQSLKRQGIPDELYSQLTKILQVPKFVTSFVYYDNQSPGGSEITIKEIDQEIDVTPKRMVTISTKQLNNINPGTVLIKKTSNTESQRDPEVIIVRKGESGVLTIEEQQIKKEVAVEPLSRRSSMQIETELVDEKDFIISEESNIIVREILPSEERVQSQFVEEAQVNIETIEAKPVVFLLDSPEASKISLELPHITMGKSLAESLPNMPVEQEIVIETEVIEDLPLPIALIQPENSEKHVLKKITESKAQKLFLRSAPKPIPVLLQQMTIPIHSFEKVPKSIQRISQQPTPKEVRIVEVRGPPKQAMIVQVNPDAQVKILENDQVIYDNRHTKITTEVIAEDDISSEIKSFKVRDFVRF